MVAIYARRLNDYEAHREQPRVLSRFVARTSASCTKQFRISPFSGLRGCASSSGNHPRGPIARRALSFFSPAIPTPNRQTLPTITTLLHYYIISIIGRISSIWGRSLGSIEILNSDVDSNFSIGRVDWRDKGFEALIVTDEICPRDHGRRTHSQLGPAIVDL